MELLKNFIEKILGATIEQTLMSDANHTTSMLFYQPIVPETLNKYSKVNKE